MTTYGLTYIYVIGGREPPVKVGYANDIEARLRGIQTSNPDEMFVHYTVKVPAGLALRTERAAHDLLSKWRRRGEWFDVHPETAQLAVFRASEFIRSNWGEEAAVGGDEVEILLASHNLDAWTREALHHYRRISSGTPQERAVAKVAAAAVVRVAGRLPLNVMNRVVLERTPLSTLTCDDAMAERRAKDALARGINALSNWYATAREKAAARTRAA